jgi:rhodanese-related sulfurtransferase
MAIRGGLSVEDLQHVELGYSPPYGAAKDPINMAGFVGGNMLRGLAQTINAEDLVDQVRSDNTGRMHLPKYQVIDVRSPEEFARGHMVGAVNVPISDLRESLDSLDAAKPVLAYCWVGYRGYLAYRILKQSGFETVNLNGGFKAVREGGYTALVEES